MKALKMLGIFCAVPIIAWLPSRFWTECGDPWCLKVFPEWLDRKIYSIVHPYLAHEMTVAAAQMDFIEVWISSVVILELIAISIVFLSQDKFRDDDLG